MRTAILATLSLSTLAACGGPASLSGQLSGEDVARPRDAVYQDETVDLPCLGPEFVAVGAITRGVHR